MVIFIRLLADNLPGVRAVAGNIRGGRFGEMAPPGLMDQHIYIQALVPIQIWTYRVYIE